MADSKDDIKNFYDAIVDIIVKESGIPKHILLEKPSYSYFSQKRRKMLEAQNAVKTNTRI